MDEVNISLDHLVLDGRPGTVAAALAGAVPLSGAVAETVETAIRDAVGDAVAAAERR